MLSNAFRVLGRYCYRYVKRLDTWTLGAQKGLLNTSVHGSAPSLHIEPTDSDSTVK